jgi:hypothetical protein
MNEARPENTDASGGKGGEHGRHPLPEEEARGDEKPGDAEERRRAANHAASAA